MKSTFLHLSDLHFRAGWPEEIDLVCERFFADLAAQAKAFSNPYLVFSGDIVFAGADANSYSSFEGKFAKALDKIGIPRERRVCIPGNHDVSRDALQPLLLLQDGTLAVTKDERQFNDSLPQLSHALFAPKFSNYAAFEGRFAQYTCCSSELGGAGWELDDGVGIYCLNTALCSYGGLPNSAGKLESDKDHLNVDTRSLYRWLTETKSTTRVLVMHHPVEWLAEWAKTEIDNVIADKFHLVLSGHLHQGSSTFASRGSRGAVRCAAPPLFTTKSGLLGYGFITIDTANPEIDVTYRQWTPTHKFVAGTSFADNDSGTKSFSTAVVHEAALETRRDTRDRGDTLAVLQAEFEEAVVCYSSKKQIWVERDLATIPETGKERATPVLISATDFCSSLHSCVIRSPKQFGLTTLGRFIALQHRLNVSPNKAVAMTDAAAIPPHRQGVLSHIDARCQELGVSRSSLAAIILDGWQNDSRSNRMLREIQKEFPTIPIILLQSIDDSLEIAQGLLPGELENVATLYLWALSRARIRELVGAYIRDLSLDDDLVTKKLTEDIDALNIHRTPLNCLLILKLLEQAFDDSPVNRTEMIGRVLYLLFYQFDKIPRYATRPDLKDCEYALGYLCEWLIRTKKSFFTKNEFFEKVQEYCSSQVLDLDSDVLFSFLVSENIFVRKGNLFEFRFRYWLYFFAAHRMHHAAEFAEWILSDSRYCATPEIIEFYTGIDRRRSDAIIRLTEDLKRMNSEFQARTGFPEGFNPLQHALWAPNPESLAKLQRQVADSVEESSLPRMVKDAIADKSYDPAKPYDQAIANFITKSSLLQLVQTMRGSARALRNSDHVAPAAKAELLEVIMQSWFKVCQVLAVISPLLAKSKSAGFEGMGFFLDETFDDLTTEKDRWTAIMTVIPDNVVLWYQEDIFSKKLGALLSTYVEQHHGSLGELLVLLVMTRQRPPGWEKVVEDFILRSDKNSYYLNRVFASLRNEFKTSFSTERTRQHQRRLAAMSVAKHETGAKRPNIKLVEKAAKALEEGDAKDPAKD